MFSTPKLLWGWVSTLESAGYRVHTPVHPGHDPVDMAVLSRVTLCPVLCVSGGADRNVATWISRHIARRYSAHEHHHPDLPHWIVATSALPQVAPPVWPGSKRGSTNWSVERNVVVALGVLIRL